MTTRHSPTVTRRLRRIRAMRIAVAIVVLAAVGVGTAANAGIGTLCAWCPLGFAQASAAAQTFLPGIVVSLIAVTVVALVAGRAFCAWGCPSNLVRKKSCSPAADAVGARSKTVRPIVLILGLLAISFIVGFPVFCLFCPIGLVFGFAFALFKSLTIYQPSWDLVILPLLLFVELRLLKSWCRVLCPLGALFGLIARISPQRLSVRADANRCQAATGCHACANACSEGVPASRLDKGIDDACTLCMECTGSCPHGALQSKVSMIARREEEKLHENA